MALAAADPPSQPPPAGATTVSGVVVNGTRAEVETSIDRKSYSVANDLTAHNGSVAEVLRNIPSVQVDAQGNPSLQGEGNVTVLIDGRPSAQFSGQTLGEALQAMPADRIDRVEVMTNPSAEFRAGGTGGIINLITRKAKGAGWTGSARISAETHDRASTTVNLGYNSDKLSVTGDVTYKHAPKSAFDTLDLSQIGPATGLAINSQDLSRKHWTYDHWGAHAGADYDLDSRTRVSGSAGYYTSRYRSLYVDQFVQDNVSGDPTSALDRTGRERYSHNGGDASLTWRRTYGEGHDLTISADFSETELRDNRTDLLAPTLPPGQAATSQQVIWTDQARRARFTMDYDRLLFGGKLQLGYGFEFAPNRIDQAAGSGGASGPITLDPAQHDVFLDEETDNEAYVSYERRFGKVTLLAGLRAENAHFDLDQQTQGVQAAHAYGRLFPNLHLAYDLGDGRQLTANYTWRTNRPSERQLDPFVTSQTPLNLQSGNANLRPDDQSRYELGFEDRRGDSATVVTLYYHHRDHAFNRLYSNLPNGVLLEETVNAGKGQTAGAELAINRKLTPTLSYNLSLDGYWIQLTSSPDIGFFPARSAVTGFGHAGLTWRLSPKDLLQLDLVTTAKGLNPQGYSSPTYSGNIGYRHVINDNVSWIVAVKDPFRTLRYQSVEDIHGVEERRVTVDSTRSVSLTLVWNFAGKPKDQGFDFGSGDSRR
ncbi:TonB-dependent receptor [Phenylobacterium sp.]|uniref:TonB-dependent receptor n=1 Tax=Phenylobacterium sp. TaxID=1871053 RepID=UPI002E318B8B|nr:TonB-dependent receptor [Phenylobacterium sp.]HEX4712580.1 TonB-dependent receptor [Phenylobacterium sp.]